MLEISCLWRLKFRINLSTGPVFPLLPVGENPSLSLAFDVCWQSLVFPWLVAAIFQSLTVFIW